LILSSTMSYLLQYFHFYNSELTLLLAFYHPIFIPNIASIIAIQYNLPFGSSGTFILQVTQETYLYLINLACIHGWYLTLFFLWFYMMNPRYFTRESCDMIVYQLLLLNKNAHILLNLDSIYLVLIQLKWNSLAPEAFLHYSRSLFFSIFQLWPHHMQKIIRWDKLDGYVQ